MLLLGFSPPRSYRALKVGDIAGAGALIACGGANEALRFLLQNVRRPPGRASTCKQRREHGSRNIQNIEQHRRPKINVRCQSPARGAVSKLGQRASSTAAATSKRGASNS